MKVGISATTFADSKLSMDGIGTYGYHLTNALENLSVDFHYYTYQTAVVKSLYQQKIHYYPNRYKISVLAALCLNKSFFNDNELDLFHVTDHLIPKLKNLPVVATIHDAIPILYPEWVPSKLRRLKNEIFKHSIQWVDHIIAISHAAVPDLMRSFKIPATRISVVHHGVSEQYFREQPEQQRLKTLAKYGLHPGYFLFVGTLQPRKNVARIIAAHAQLPKEIKKKYPLVIIGRDGWRTENLISQLDGLQQSQQGKWLKYVPQEDLHGILQSALAFVFPSLYEGFGLPVLEAFAAKIPVITSNITALPEVAGDAALLVNPQIVGEIRNAMEEITLNAAGRKELILRGYQRAQAMSWSQAAKKTLEVYQKIL